MVRYGHPRSFKVIVIGTNRKPYQSSIVTVCLFSVISEIGRKSAFRRIYSPHSRLKPSLGMFLLDL